MTHRLPALDWLRGIVMVLMAIDHASASWNAGRLVTDSPFLYEAGMALPAGQFLTRWITHLCAPTFLFLAGTSLALSAERRARAGTPAAAIDRDMLARGLIICGLDPLFISFVWWMGVPLLQVLFAIGLSMILMIPLRRLATAWHVGIGIGLLAAGEILIGVDLTLNGGSPSLVGGLFLSGGQFPWLLVIYPVLPWMAMMMLGWALGRQILAVQGVDPLFRATRRLLTGWGLAAIALFAVVRGLNAYGNMRLLREDGSWIQWLHFSKYPPALSFSAFELGLMALLLASLIGFQNRLGDRFRSNNPLLVFGQTAFFFYLLHIPLLDFSARLLGEHHRLGLGATYAATLAVLVVLYPACLWYRRYKAAHRGSWLRYI
jgi:uncharacterized membrane protein